MHKLSTIAYEKALRLPDNNRRANLTKKSGQKSIKKCDWRNKIKEIWNEVFDQDQTEAFLNNSPPCKEVNNVHFIKTNVTKKQDKEEQRNLVIKERSGTTIYRQISERRKH